MWRWQSIDRKTGDVESGAVPLYPMMLESPELRWAFIRKVYSILTVQILLTVAVIAVVVFVHPVANFFVATTPGFALYIVLCILPFLLVCPLSIYHQHHPVNLILLGLYTLSLSFLVGLSCAFTNGKVVLEAAILTAVVFVSLTIYTFWAARHGHDFQFLGPFLFASLIVLLVFCFIQIFFPFGKIMTMIYGVVGAIIFSGYIIYDTDNLIKRHSYDEYVLASVALYLDILNLFISLLSLLRSTDS